MFVVLLFLSHRSSIVLLLPLTFSLPANSPLKLKLSSVELDGDDLVGHNHSLRMQQ